MYHVINRGNYRRDLFVNPDEAKAFLETVKETKGRMGWRVHAYALMRNHCHLAIETPEPNLAEGMHWLQGTWANRFNRFRRENGQLFQGRLKGVGALFVDLWLDWASAKHCRPGKWPESFESNIPERCIT